MKLHDYSKCIEINRLMVAMGVSSIPTLPVVKFEREIVQRFEREYIDQESVRIDEQLISGTIPVNKSDIVQRPGEALELNGGKIVAYIRDQKSAVNFHEKRTDYKYHLFDCRTMQAMKDIGREHRYLATRKNNEIFDVYDLTSNPIQSGSVHMDLCKNCAEILRRKGKYSYPFNLKKYFEENNSYIPKTIKKIEEVRSIQTYSPNQKDYSREYRKACHYKCQSCSVDCSELPGLLHMHHVDGNPANNRRHNLQILCVDCHSLEPMHKHMRRSPKFKREIDMIDKLRTVQGILSVYRYK